MAPAIALQRVDLNGAGKSTLCAGDRLAEGRLAGTVLADQRVHLAGVEIEVDVLDGMHTAVDLAAMDDVQHRLLGRDRCRYGSGQHLVHVRPPERSSSTWPLPLE